ncbi:hypothetical protein [Yersinia proxima]|uniref:hypothetical protein n=1 Tax=Yersinia proxima TaxID=2890316 RepID=UPI001D1289B1|nr:hypothetical protein [Yersinia proxima]
MTTKKTKDDDNEINREEASEVQEAATKTCFIIMPIADVPSYESGHFNRVYQHLIAPACRKAGFKPIRADEVNSSNMIVLDILKKIVECDMAICDLSSRNPNVLYELGLRQAFNKKTVLIKDKITTSPFDVQAFRYAEYDNSLRIDYVQNEIASLAIAIKSTYEAQNDINSIVQLLQIEPAQIGEKTQLSTPDTMILSAIRDLTNRIDAFSNNDITSRSTLNNGFKIKSSKNILDINNDPIFIVNGQSAKRLRDIISNENVFSKFSEYEFYRKGESIGRIDKIDPAGGKIVFLNSSYMLDTFEITPDLLDNTFGIKVLGN